MTTASMAQSPKASIDSGRSAEASKHSSLHKITKKIVQAAKEHHQSVNAAFGAYYGVAGYKPADGSRVNWTQ